MGILKAVAGSVSGVLADQWKEVFCCDALQPGVFLTPGVRKAGSRSANTKGDENVITSGSLILVAEGQCALIVEGGQVTACSDTPGEYVFSSGDSPSVFSGGGMGDFFRDVGNRIGFGGVAPVTQRVFYLSTREIPACPFASAGGIPIRIRDPHTGADWDLSVQCSGVYSWKIRDPLTFYRFLSSGGGLSTRQLQETMASELLTVLGPALSALCSGGIRPYALGAQTEALCRELEQRLAEPWLRRRGIGIVSLGIASLCLLSRDRALLQQLQQDAVLRDPELGAAMLVGSAARAMQSAASGPGTFALAVPQMPSPWTCSCGARNRGNFCGECGKPRPGDL